MPAMSNSVLCNGSVRNSCWLLQRSEIFCHVSPGRPLRRSVDAPADSTPSSTLLSLDLLRLVPVRAHRFLAEPDLAADRHRPDIWFPHRGRGIHDHLQRHGSTSGVELVSLFPGNRWHPDRIRCIGSCCRGDQECIVVGCTRYILEHGDQRGWWFHLRGAVPVLRGKCMNSSSIPPILNDLTHDLTAGSRHFVLIWRSSAICPTLCSHTGKRWSCRHEHCQRGLSMVCK